MSFHIVHTDVVSLQNEWACDISDVIDVQMSFHIVHTDLVSQIPCELPCDVPDSAAVQMPSYILDTQQTAFLCCIQIFLRIEWWYACDSCIECYTVTTKL